MRAAAYRGHTLDETPGGDWRVREHDGGAVEHISRSAAEREVEDAIHAGTFCPACCTQPDWAQMPRRRRRR